MIFLNRRGQAMTLFVLLLPVLVLLMGIIIRSGKTLLTHQNLENHCNKKVLDALAEQGKGLGLLGALNPRARHTIDQKRETEVLLRTAAEPGLAIVLQATLIRLQMIQVEIEAQQKLITMNALKKSLAVMTKKAPVNFAGKINENFGPQTLLTPHQARSYLGLHVMPEMGYESEVGPPLQLDLDFIQRQEVHGKIVSHTEKFLDWWSRLQRAPDMSILCSGKIQMNSLEGKWTAQLEPTTAKPSLKLSLE